MVWLLDYNVDILALLTAFTVEYSDNEKVDITVFMTPSHIIKLVWNAFGEKIILKYKNDYIQFKFVKHLCLLQEKYGYHLENKLGKKKY